MDVFKADQGNMSMNGKTFSCKDYNIGYLPEERGLYPKRCTFPSSWFICSSTAWLVSWWGRHNLKKWLKLAGNREYENRVLDTLSKEIGSRNEGTAGTNTQTLMCDPDIVILDEPFSGLDPVNSQTLKKSFRNRFRMESLWFFCSIKWIMWRNSVRISLSCIMEMVLQGNLVKQIKKNTEKNRIVINSCIISKSRVSWAAGNTVSRAAAYLWEKDGGFIIELQPNVNKRDVLTRMLELEVDLEAFQLYEASLTDIFVSKGRWWGMRDFLLVLKFELQTMVRKKSFLISTVLVAAAAFCPCCPFHVFSRMIRERMIRHRKDKDKRCWLRWKRYFEKPWAGGKISWISDFLCQFLVRVEEKRWRKSEADAGFEVKRRPASILCE